MTAGHDLPVSASPSPPSGTEPVPRGSPPSPAPVPPSDEPTFKYRLSMVDRDGRRRDLAPLYDTTDDAAAAALHILRMLAGRPAKRPQYLTVFDLWTGEVMRTVRPSDVGAGGDRGPFGGAA